MDAAAQAYRTDVGPRFGPFPYLGTRHALAVIDPVTDRACGVAAEPEPLETDRGTVATFHVWIDDEPLPGRWAIFGREFVPITLEALRPATRRSVG